MLRNVMMFAMALTLMSSQAFAGGGGKNNGTLVVTNASALPQANVAIVIDPPAAWAAWVAPFTAAQKAALTKRATVVAPGGSQSFAVKKGSHRVLAVNSVTELYTLTSVTIVDKQTTSITVTP